MQHLYLCIADLKVVGNVTVEFIVIASVKLSKEADNGSSILLFVINARYSSVPYSVRCYSVRNDMLSELLVLYAISVSVHNCNVMSVRRALFWALLCVPAVRWVV